MGTSSNVSLAKVSSFNESISKVRGGGGGLELSYRIGIALSCNKTKQHQQCYRYVLR